ncbi:DNA gyrase inhibitor YacG [Pikeienuella piscinae]|uniref:DNA gyrase inhibitor YacG n=1 Tax=Pikeienuella piscinae TaxID=2748098 RepID=A0A7M3T5K4_9RHOB|nr:DNA gyrase inhibitor YacG [Pikeienuella piscinae]QIE57285.1 DNA gyrase inhibitor YacG [Pikeienuella piscinae]
MSECPICGAPTETRWRPFCSKRCADIDLGRWLTGAYAVPVDETEDDEPDRERER